MHNEAHRQSCMRSSVPGKKSAVARAVEWITGRIRSFVQMTEPTELVKVRYKTSFRVSEDFLTFS